jgi:hypothetical protein
MAWMTQLYPLSAYLGFPQRAHTKPLERVVHFSRTPTTEHGMAIANLVRIQ